MRLVMTGTRPTPEVLQHFQRFQRLSTAQREALARQLEVSTAAPGQCLLELGSTTDNTLYLLEGKVELRAEDGGVRIINAGDPAARMPISRLRPSLYRVTARSTVRYISIRNQVLEELLQFERPSSILVEESYLVEEDELQGGSETERAVSGRILDDLRQGRLLMPSVPEVSERAGRAILAAGEDEQAITRALMTEPVLAAKMIQAANRARGNDTTETVADAVRRLGSTKVASAAVNCVLRETLRTRNNAIRAAMRSWWERSLRVSAICQVLARQSERFDPELAATAGLLHRIGEPVLLCYVNLLNRRIDAHSLRQLLAGHRAEITRLVATMSHYGPELRTALMEAGDPLRSRPGPADYADILLVAQRHADIGSDASAGGPALDEMPAVERLGLGKVSPEFSLRIVEAARDAVDQASRLLEA